MSGRVVFTVGSVLRGDDAAGPLLAKMLENNPAEGWTVIDGGQTPEDELAVVRRMQPDFLLLVDAADMGEAVGTVCALDEDDVMTDFLMTTHSLPMTFLLGNLRESCRELLFLGIQPGDTSFFAPLTPPVRQAVESLYAWLREGGDVREFQRTGGGVDKVSRGVAYEQ
ncbi:MAG: hydrogenase maturation peptidase HycI [Coriobacteriales bacterium]|jgi:hydrogenase 3 maturation protease|nr:hydrogenase maturation peptidase HycI [Coriobacteriales bacterium]